MEENMMKTVKKIVKNVKREEDVWGL